MDVVASFAIEEFTLVGAMGKSSMIKMKRSPLSLSSGAVCLLALLGCHPLLPPTQFADPERQYCSDIIYIYMYNIYIYSDLRIHLCDYIAQNSPAEMSHRDQGSASVVP